MSVRRWSALIFLVVTGFLVLFPAGKTWSASPLPVAASIVPLADFCRQLGGDLVKVQLLIPPGASPHTFEPSPGLLQQAAQAKVLVYIGAGLEPWIERFVASLKGKKPLTVVASAGMPLIAEVDQHQHEEPASGKKAGGLPGKGGRPQRHQHETGGANPHIWLDPVLAQDICRRIATALAQADPEHAAVYHQNLEVYLAKLAQLHERLQQLTAGFRLREFVSFHPSFTYFARRYGLQEAGVIEVAPGREPSPKALQRLVTKVRQAGIKVIFSEPQFSPRLAEVLARETGAKVLLLDPLGGRPPYGDNYLALMEYNAATMAAAMR